MKILTLLFLGLVFESAGIVLIFPILSFIEIGGILASLIATRQFGVPSSRYIA